VIHLTLRLRPIRTGTLVIGGVTYELATWHKAAGGYMQATTTDGQRVTLATADHRGSVTIGNSDDAPRWILWGLERDGLELRGKASLALTDEWLAGFIERLGQRVQG